jgi:hypothetical protein
MPRISITVSEALHKELKRFASLKHMSVSKATALLLTDRFEVAAQDNEHGGPRQKQEKQS